MGQALPPIPERLKELRTARGISLDDLAKKSGVSRAMLSKIERGAASPTIGLLCKITGSLGVPLTRLVSEPEPGHCRVIREKEVSPIVDKLSGVKRVSITGELPEWGIEVVRYDLPAGSTTGECGGCPKVHREIVHVESGEVEILVGARRETLRSGETLLLDGCEKAFEVRNRTRKPARFYNVVDRRPT